MSPNDPNSNGHDDQVDETIGLAPGQDDDERTYRDVAAGRESTQADANLDTAVDLKRPSINAAKNSAAPGKQMSDALRWALDSMHQPAMASADWLARDIDPAHPTVVDLLTNPSITLDQVRQAKSVFKTMRIVGEKSADRRVGARMYAAAIAAGIVRFGRKVSTQSDAALKRGFQGLLDDRRMPMPLRDLAGMALCSLKDTHAGNPFMSEQSPNGRSNSA